MYLPIPQQPDCLTTWFKATREVAKQKGRSAHNVVMDVADPTRIGASIDAIRMIEGFLESGGAKPLMTVANTIFPQGIYQTYGRDGLYSTFHERLLPKIRKSCKWTGYYFERLTRLETADGREINPLEDVVSRLADPKNRSRNKFELTVFDPARDLSNSPYGGQCLSHLSFKVVGPEKKLTLTAFYRNHYYIEKLLGNLIGLGRLMNFVGRETGLPVGNLTVLSGSASIDCAAGWTAPDVLKLLDRVDAALQQGAAANQDELV